MEYVLKIKDKNGNWLTIPAIKGASNYELAVANGYSGTEAEWIELLKPTAKVTKVEDGNSVEITDAYGTVSFTVRDGKTITKVSELENDTGYLKDNSGSGAYVNYGAGYEVCIGASAAVRINTGGQVHISGGGDIAADFGGQRLTNIASPQNSKDAVTKEYLESQGYIASGNSGAINLEGSSVTISGGSFTIGNLSYGLSVSNNRIQNVGTPTESTDAVNKSYVDNLVGNIDGILQTIIAAQEALIGGDA